MAQRSAPASSAPRPEGQGRRVRGLDAEQRRARRRDDLLAASLSLFGDKGYANVSIEEICQTAYVGTKSFYEHFDSKEACYLALFDQLGSTLQARVQGALADQTGTDPAGIDDFIRTFAGALMADPRIPKVLFSQSTSVSPAVERRRRANRRWAASLIETIWRQYGIIGPEAPRPWIHNVTIGLVGALFELIADWLADHDPSVEGDIESLIQPMIEFHHVVRDGLAAR
ncbi:TetR/AcrR family transcriptional regulator [Actinocrispum wychmicini]|nr:TetR/AcrR family transcriptional regulator [Actinocrispum wychmicini]